MLKALRQTTLSGEGSALAKTAVNTCSSHEAQYSEPYKTAAAVQRGAKRCKKYIRADKPVDAVFAQIDHARKSQSCPGEQR